MTESKPPTGMKMLGDRKSFLRLQKCLIHLEQGRYDVLEEDRMVTELASYLFDLYRSRYFDFTHNILNILGECCVCPSAIYREKALFVLSLFAERTAQDTNDESMQALSWIFSRWLKQEQEFLGCFEFVCRQIQTLLERMLSRGKYCQLTPWLMLLGKISSGEMQRTGAIQALISRLHSSLIGSLVFQEAGFGREVAAAWPEETACLYRYYSEGGVVALVKELYACPDKDRRLALIATLSSLDDDTAYVLIENLEADSPWYMIRNAIQIISRLGNVSHFDLVQPFLGYPDVRVQQQVVAFISRLDGKNALEQRLRALEVCDDSLKFQLIPKLSETGSKIAELALLRMLENYTAFDSAIRDELVMLLCSELSHFPTIRALKSLQELVEKRKREDVPEDPIIVVAEQTIGFLSSV